MYKEIYNFISSNIDDRKIPNIKNIDWNTFIKQYDKELIKQALANYIVDNNIPFPSKIISRNEWENLFLNFCKTSMLSQYKHFDTVLDNYDYKYKYSEKPLGVIDKSHVYNSVSNYFQQENRMRCGSNASDSPWDIWHNKEKLQKMNWHFWRSGALGKDNVCDKTFRSAFRIGTYTATQFKPNVAKALYEKHNARLVLDTSSGWGDRLAGFYATSCTEEYVGCDPNVEVYETYKTQCLEYENLLGCDTAVLQEYSDHFVCIGTKKVTIYNLPCEDLIWDKYSNYFDFYFTSPPYYETERYGSSNPDNQSYMRYPDFDSWKNKFFFTVNKKIYSALKNDAYMMINIIEPRTKNNVRLNLCDDMVDHILTFEKAHYIGKIGMRLQARPHKIIKTNNNAVFIEPIYVFRKNNINYTTVESSNFNNFFK